MRLHVASCHDCTEYTEKLLRFESRLDRALRVNVDGAQPRNIRSALPRPDRSRTVRSRGTRWLAIAASVLVAAVVAGSLWVAAPRDSLAADVVGHMAGEPDAWSRTDIPVPEPKLSRVLSDSHVGLKANAGLVSYASSCLFRGHQVPHLVVQTGAGPVTVMVLTHESVRKSVNFDEQGYRGVIVPVQGHGSLAVLERGPSPDMKALEGVTTRVLGAIDYTR